MREASVQKRKNRVGGADATDGGKPEQLQLLSLKDVAHAGYELADIVLERARIEEAKGVYLRRQRARLKELETQIKELSVALNARQAGPQETEKPKEQTA